jgi:hypothetical protein
MREVYQVVPDGASGKCLDHRKQGGGLGKNVCVGGEQPKPSPAHPKRAAVETQQ